MIYRVKQFIWALTATINNEEKQFIKDYLTMDEEKLFSKLRVYEQKHSIRVAQGMLINKLNEDGRDEVRLGLLHDVGKSVYPIGPVRKSIMVLLDKFTGGRVAKYSFIKMVKCYYEHPQLGYKLLKQEGKYNEGFLELVKKHHEVLGEENKVLENLQYWDNQA